MSGGTGYVIAVTGPLEGIRVVDLSAMISGPIATMLLGDQGADVIKVEAPGSGDLVRGIGSARAGIAPMFATSNRSKRAVVIDLKHDRGLAVLQRLVAGADVFVQNFRPGAAQRMGIGEDAIREIRPDIVYVSISGFGETGPYAHKRVYDPIIQALSGLASIQGDRVTGRPRMVRTILPDKLTAITAAQAITRLCSPANEQGRGNTSGSRCSTRWCPFCGRRAWHVTPSFNRIARGRPPVRRFATSSSKLRTVS